MCCFIREQVELATCSYSLTVLIAILSNSFFKKQKAAQINVQLSFLERYKE